MQNVFPYIDTVQKKATSNISAMDCLLLQKCLKQMENDDDGDDINVQVSCACCGGVVKESKIEDNVDGTEKTEEKVESRREEIEPNLLRSQSSGSTRLCSCFGGCGESATEKDKGMVEKTANVHITSTGTQELSLS